MNKNMSDTPSGHLRKNAGRTIEVAMGTTLLEVERQLRLDGPHPFLAAYVNNRIKELNYRIYKPVTVRFIDITSFEGIRVYQRTISFILQKAVRERFPTARSTIRHSLGASGFYCEISGFDRFRRTPRRDQGPHARDHRPQPADPGGVKMLTDTARKIYEGFGMTDKIALLDSRPRLYSKNLYDRLPAGLFLRSPDPFDGLHSAVRPALLLQRLLHRPAAADRPDATASECPPGEDVRRLPPIPVVGGDHGRSDRRTAQLESSRGRRQRA